VSSVLISAAASSHVLIKTKNQFTMMISPTQTTNPGRMNIFFKDAHWLGAKHDGFSLASFPDYRELRKPRSQRPPAPSQSDSYEMAALYQSCLTFGLLEAVIETKIPESLLLHTTLSGEVIMGSYNLPYILGEWRLRIRSLRNADMDAHNKWFDRIQKTLTQARGLLMIEIRRPDMSYFRSAGLQDEIITGILYAIAAIGEALMSTTRQFLIQPKSSIDWTFVITPTDHYNQEMVAAGWCPFTAKTLSQGVCMLSYASTCTPFIRSGAGRKGHGECNWRECV
jgi:hypothetical protein